MPCVLWLPHNSPGTVAGDTVIDVGANLGAFTIPLSQFVGQSGRVLAFEAQDELMQLLTANLAMNEIRNVVAEKVIITNESGVLQLPQADFSRPMNFGGFSVVDPDIVRASGSNSAKLDHVMKRTLDSFFGNSTVCPTFLKVDVEGMELNVLRGATNLLSRCHPILYLENNCKFTSRPVIEFVSSLDYDLYWDIHPYFNPANFLNNSADIFTEGWCIHPSRARHCHMTSPRLPHLTRRSMQPLFL